MNIGIVAETAPAKTMIPIIDKLDDDIYSFTHSEGAQELLSQYSEETVPIGASRNSLVKKRSRFTMGRLVFQDTRRTYNAMKDKNLDLVLTCGNAGDVRKAIIASNRLKIPVLHLEQDIYNPIEMIAYANIITVPDRSAKKKLKMMYGITNTVNIRGYPQAEYVSTLNITDPEKIYAEYNSDDFYVLFLGGDTRTSDIPIIMDQMAKLDKTVFVVATRFDIMYLQQFIKSTNVFLVDGFVDMISLMNASSGVIYCAGMGITIELGVLSTPAIKIEGFHTEHASNDLAKSLSIPVVSVYDVTTLIDKIKPTNGHRLAKNGSKAAGKVAELTHEMKMFDQTKGGRRSLRRIWDQRKKYR